MASKGGGGGGASSGRSVGAQGASAKLSGRTLNRAILDQIHGRGMASTSDIVSALGPKTAGGIAKVKRAMVSLADKGRVFLHFHDFPHSLTRAERRLMPSVYIPREARRYHAIYQPTGREYYVGIALR